MRATLSILAVVLFTAGCGGGSGQKSESAQKTPYDPEESGLEGENVQAALDELAAQVAALQTDLATANATIAALQSSGADHETRLDDAETGMNVLATDVDDHAVRLTTVEMDSATHASGIADLQTDLADVSTLTLDHATRLGQAEADITGLESKTQYQTVDTSTLNGLVGPHVIFEGVNIHIRNGEGCTNGATNPPGCSTNLDTGNGSGNLIVGYNEANGTDASFRNGSHGVVVGPYHQYASVGGLLAGSDNRTLGRYSSVSGGTLNEASGLNSSVCGGVLNQANGLDSTVSGGLNNTASGSYSSVSGGYNNVASGDRSSVSGGFARTASGQYDWAAGALFEQQ